MAAALAAFARDEGIGPGRRAVEVMDNAGWHHARELAVPEGVHPFFLPPWSPELRPAERLWGLVDEPVANRVFPDLDVLENVLVARCRELERRRAEISPRCRYHWWPKKPTRIRL